MNRKYIYKGLITRGEFRFRWYFSRAGKSRTKYKISIVPLGHTQDGKVKELKSTNYEDIFCKLLGHQARKFAFNAIAENHTEKTTVKKEED